MQTLSLTDFLLVAINFSILCVAIVALGDWRKLNRERRLLNAGGEKATRRQKYAMRRARLGLKVTFAWFLVFSMISLANGLPNSASSWGDWAAGMFAPVAFAWLVLGYYQQGEELRDNVKALRLQEDALRLQVRELKDSVEQQTVMAQAASRQAELLEKSHALALRAQLLPHQPLPSEIMLVELRERGLHLNLKNFGAAATSVHVSLTPLGQPENFPTSLGDWRNGHLLQLPVSFPEVKIPFHAALVLRYVDALSIEQSQRFVIAFVRLPAGGQPLSVSRTAMSFNLPD